MNVKEGEFVSILGPSGCGKSTILSIIAQVIEQTEGSVRLKHRDHHHLEDSIGYMLQQDYLFPWKTIIDNVLLGPKISKTLGNDSRKLANELLEEVGLPDVAEKYPSSLSGGMRQRVALVRTLINDPKILLLDE